MIISIYIPNHFHCFLFIAKSTIHFEGNKWVHNTVDKDGKESVVTRYIDASGQQMIVSHFSYFVFFYLNEFNLL